VARVIGAKLTEAWGQQVVVQNMPGASGVIAFSYVAKAAPDGYTILMGYDALAMVPFTMKALPYDTVKDLTPVDQVARTTMVLVAQPSLPVKSVGDLIALAKSKPGQLTFAEFGAPIWFPAELLNSMAGIKLERVGYKERSAAVVDVMAGRVDVMFSSLVSMLPNIQSGKVRALAVAGQSRSPALPDVPTISETAGLQGYDFSSWLGFLVPAGTPSEIVTKLNSEVAKIVVMPDVQKQLSGQVDLLNSTPEQFAALIRSDIAKWSTLQIKID
jgi:tripartite-type tricarboxylate transporter receptor subunit TctC